MNSLSLTVRTQVATASFRTCIESFGEILATDFSFGEKSSINEKKEIKRKDVTHFVYKVYVTYTPRATRCTELFSIRVTPYGTKFCNVQNHDILSQKFL